MTTPRKPWWNTGDWRGLAVAPILAFALAFSAAPATAQSGGTGPACSHFIDALPATITEPGVYCLQSDFWYDQPWTAITIQVPDVTLDCRGYAVDGTPLPNNTGANGVVGWADAKRVVIRNCSFRGFLFGIQLYGGGLVEDNLIRGPSAEGIYIEGDNSIIRRNRLFEIGNSQSGFKFAWGIVTFGDIDIIDNDIDGVVATPGGGQNAIGIVANDGYESTQTYVIRGNRIRGLKPDVGQQAYGISIGSTGQLDIRDNVLFGDDVDNAIGIYCWNGPDWNISGNDIYDFEYPTWACTPDADNVIRD